MKENKLKNSVKNEKKLLNNISFLEEGIYNCVLLDGKIFFLIIIIRLYYEIICDYQTIRQFKRKMVFTKLKNRRILSINKKQEMNFT